MARKIAKNVENRPKTPEKAPSKRATQRPEPEVSAPEAKPRRRRTRSVTKDGKPRQRAPKQVDLEPVRPANNLPARNFFDIVGTDRLVEAYLCSDDDKVRGLADRLADPAYSRKTFPALLREMNLSFSDAFEAFKNYIDAEVVMTAMQRSPKIVSDIADDAENRSSQCRACTGSGHVVIDGTERLCPICFGGGMEFTKGDKDARAQLLEISGFLGKKAPLIAVQKNTQNNYGGGNASVTPPAVLDLIKKGNTLFLTSGDDPAGDVIDVVPDSGEP